MLFRLITLVGFVFSINQANAQILPKNDLHLQDNINVLADITEEEFSQIIDDVTKFYKPIVELNGGVFRVNKLWSSSTVNAFARQTKMEDGTTEWLITMYGGLARRPEVTKDAFALVVCHELGHHLAGYPFYPTSLQWAASEGQADYFATQACARKIWQEDYAKNASFRDSIDETAKEGCDSIWKTVEAQNLCYRITDAGRSLATLLAALGSKGAPKFDTPDERVVDKTNHRHPAAQCRLDTYFAGALCKTNYDFSQISGKLVKDGPYSVEAEKIATYYSCSTRRGWENGKRPRCWYAPQISDDDDGDDGHDEPQDPVKDPPKKA